MGKLFLWEKKVAQKMIQNNIVLPLSKDMILLCPLKKKKTADIYKKKSL